MENTIEKIVELFVATDQHKWSVVQKCFSDQVELDYSSMNGNPAISLSPAEIVSAWQAILPGFENTHHQLGNFISEVNGTTAHVFC